jgi:hypothetical protein
VQDIGSHAAASLVLPTVLKCAVLSPTGPLAPMQATAQAFLVAFAVTLPASAVHRLLLFPLLLQLSREECVATTLVLVRSALSL